MVIKINIIEEDKIKRIIKAVSKDLNLKYNEFAYIPISQEYFNFKKTIQ